MRSGEETGLPLANNHCACAKQSGQVAQPEKCHSATPSLRQIVESSPQLEFCYVIYKIVKLNIHQSNG